MAAQPLGAGPQLECLSVEYLAGRQAVLRAGRPLHYHSGADPAADHPAHVRAASALRRHGARLLVVQDDVNAFALVDAAGRVEPLLLPRGPDGRRVYEERRGTKRLKMDLEACVALGDGRLVVFGSGSSPRREQVVIVGAHAEIEVRAAPELYRQLRRCAEGLGAELNVEGAVLHDGHVRLLQRGNDAAAAQPEGGNALLDIDAMDFRRWIDDAARDAPAVSRVVRVALGAVDGVAYGFTDGTVAADGALAFLACAEDSADVRSDGPVAGCLYGWIADGRACVIPVVDDQGRPAALKLEGLESRPGRPDLYDVVADVDHPDEPALLLELHVER